MISSIIQHEVQLAFAKRKNWYIIAVTYAILGCIFNLLINNFIKTQHTLIGTHGITEEVVHPYYASFCLIALFCIPTICTNAIANEKSRRTILNYYCTNLNGSQFIIGKFLALNILLLAALLVASILPLTIILSGALDWGQLLSGILGVYLVLTTTISIGLFISSNIQSLLRCTFAILLTLIGLTLIEWAAQFSGEAALTIQKFGLLAPLKDFLNGTIKTQNLLYYLALSISALILASYKFRDGETNA